MKILILGGTEFVGRHLTTAALARGHDVTHFNRGKTAPNAFRDVPTILGDRDGGLAPLEDGSWDAVLDTSGYVPRVVGASARLLSSRASFYAFVSSVSAYADLSVRGVDEEAPLAELDDPESEELPAKYGPLKVACERVVRSTFAERALIVRPGLIVGPHDPTDRFTYWPVRLARGGTVLAPAPPDQRVQWIDARDLAEWMIRRAEAGAGGVFNAVGPAEITSFGALIEGCRRAAGSAAEIAWTDPEHLAKHGVDQWLDLPLWIARPHAAGLLHVDGSRALDAGLTCRSLEETARDTLEWARTRPADHAWQAGLSAEREAVVLAGSRAPRR